MSTDCRCILAKYDYARCQMLLRAGMPSNLWHKEDKSVHSPCSTGYTMEMQQHYSVASSSSSRSKSHQDINISPHSCCCFLPETLLAIREHLPTVSRLWNELPEEIVAIRQRDGFKQEANAFLSALHQRPPPGWRGTAALPRKKSTHSLVPCVSTRPKGGEGQLLCQGRSQRILWCLASAPAPRVERDSCSAKEEVNAFLGALRQRPPQGWIGTAALPRKKHT